MLVWWYLNKHCPEQPAVLLAHPHWKVAQIAWKALLLYTLYIIYLRGGYVHQTLKEHTAGELLIVQKKIYIHIAIKKDI